MSIKDQPAAEHSSRPLNGKEYLESLKDGREVWIYGRRVEDVTTHPAFRNTAQSIAALYDCLHDPAQQNALTVETDTGSGGYTHRFFRASKTPQEYVAARDAIAHWQRKVYGWLGRSPDYKASFLGTLGACPEFYDPYQKNALAWYKKCQERVYFLNHAIVNPPIDRHRPPDEVEDVYVRVKKETDAGLIVSGAKVVATGSALTHYNFIAHHTIPIKKKDFAAVFMIPMNTPGLKLLCRASYEMTAAVMGSPFDYPLSSRLDENDAILVLDEVLVPWENVFIYGDLDKIKNFAFETGFVHRFGLHGCTRLAVKLDFIAGLLLKAVDCTGASEFRSVQASVGEVIGWRNIFWALTDSMTYGASASANGIMLPNIHSVMSYRMIMAEAYPRIKQIIEQVVASGLIYLNSSSVDFKVPELRPYLDKYLRGSKGIPAVDRVKLMKLLWDAVGTEFGGRHELYEMNYSGNHEAVRVETLYTAMSDGTEKRMRELVDQCLSEYDLDGWTMPGFHNPDQTNVVLRKP